MTLGVVGHEAAKFTPETEAQARAAIRDALVTYQPTVVISGACHLGGIDIWAVEEAKALGLATLEFAPRILQWHPPGGGGFMDRNLDIANASDVLLVVVVTILPESYEGMRFPYCYHCHTSSHIKSGGCWTGHRARRMGKQAHWIEI